MELTSTMHMEYAYMSLADVLGPLLCTSGAVHLNTC